MTCSLGIYRLVLQIKGDLQIVYLILGDMDDIADGHRIDDGVGGGFHNLQAVKGLEQGLAGNDNALVLHHNGGAGYAEILGSLFLVGVDLAVGQTLDITQQNVAFGNGSGVELGVGNGKCHCVDRVGQQNSADLGMVGYSIFAGISGSPHHLLAQKRILSVF